MVRESDISEQAAGRRMIDLARQIDAWHAGMEVAQTAPPPGSPLAADDRVCAPFHVSHAVWMALSHAVDNLHAFRTLTLTGGPNDFRLSTRPYGAYPNLRATVENASVALWLLGPASRNERVLRRLRWALDNARNRDRLATDMPSVARTYADTEASVNTVATSRGIALSACKAPPRFNEIVRDAGPLAHFEPSGAVAIWRVLSGMTHGDVWATFSVAEKERLFQMSDGVQALHLTTSVDVVVTLCEVGVVFVGSTLDLLSRRQTAPFQ
jgi:hypothetical protein